MDKYVNKNCEYIPDYSQCQNKSWKYYCCRLDKCDKYNMISILIELHNNIHWIHSLDTHS